MNKQCFSMNLDYLLTKEEVHISTVQKTFDKPKNNTYKSS